MIITPAVPEDLGLLIAFRDEASRWLAARGVDQWTKPWPTEDLMAKGMLRNIRAGETFIVWDDDGTPAATVTVDRWANPDLWTPEEAAEPALYAHKLTVARAYAGCGLGVELLDWAGSRAAVDGAKWLRVDVWTTNRELRQYYLGPEPVWLRVARWVAAGNDPAANAEVVVLVGMFRRGARRSRRGLRARLLGGAPSQSSGQVQSGLGVAGNGLRPRWWR